MTEPDNDNLIETQYDKGLVEPERLILIGALLISLPLYFLILYLTWDLYPEEIVSTSKGRSQIAIPVKRPGGMNFASIELKPIESGEEFTQQIVMTFEPRSGTVESPVYLRSGTFEMFTARSMNSTHKRTSDSSWPNFALKGYSEKETGHTISADMIFFCNHEARLPHMAAIKRLAGPLPYSAMQDGSVLLEKTIAPGDIFETESALAMPLNANDVLEPGLYGSVFLSAGPLESPELGRIAADIAEKEGRSAATVFKFVKYLEENGVYQSNFQHPGKDHPVKEFLTGSMRGHCQHFAAALVALCRLQGIQARVATGYASSLRREKRFIVVGAMAHAWAEILTVNGWKAVEVKPKRVEQPPYLAADFEVPTDFQLDQVLEKLKSENTERYGSDNNDDEDDQNHEPARMNQDEVGNAAFSTPETPGMVVGDSARTERAREAVRVAIRREENKKRQQQRHKLLKNILAIMIFAALAWFARKKGNKLLNWLLKLLKKKKQKDADNIEVIEKELKDDIEELLARSETILEGKSIVELFNRFTIIMAERSNLPRNEFETPGEYFNRVCLELNIRISEGRNAASCFEAELYGRKASSASEIRNFLVFLQLILNKLK